ncbi:MAG: coproporphyrinogen III oxidase, partial [Planctomycetaceae bacterium]
ADRVSEALMLALRLREGFLVRDFEDRFSIQLQQFAGGTVRRLRDQGLLELVEGTLRLTPDGLLLADTVAAEMLNPEAGH